MSRNKISRVECQEGRSLTFAHIRGLAEANCPEQRRRKVLVRRETMGPWGLEPQTSSVSTYHDYARYKHLLRMEGCLSEFSPYNTGMNYR
jgi:hypothetical protein